MSALERIRAELEAATPGPWEVHGHEIIRRNSPPQVPWATVVSDCEEKSTGAGVVAEPDATLIAHAPTYLTALLDVAEAARRVLDIHVTAEHPKWPCAICDLAAALTRLEATP